MYYMYVIQILPSIVKCSKDTRRVLMQRYAIIYMNLNEKISRNIAILVKLSTNPELKATIHSNPAI